MANKNLLPWFSAVVLSAAACNSAYADRIGPEPRANGKVAVALPTPVAQSPYTVDLIDQNGHTLNTYQRDGRFYVLGSVGDRYSIRVTNPTDSRVEALISVDGLDVIDGKTSGFEKRGYVVPAHGELKVDGFRVSTSQVATFRFSSVASSYAGRKGKARNVGVIGVAIFAEKARPQIVVPIAKEPYDYRGRRDRYYDLDEGDDAEYEKKSADKPAAEAPAPPRMGGTAGAGSETSEDSAGAPAPRTTVSRRMEHRPRPDPNCCGARPKKRPGLGTEFGEQRHSAVSFTRFERAHQTRPTALAELRYNDRDGLVALGIKIGPTVSPEEISTRETADPFPGAGFSAPPIGWR